eukprot:COSAG01_NODE_84_length_27672_cov_60.966344_29_plen_56_part_00
MGVLVWGRCLLLQDIGVTRQIAPFYVAITSHIVHGLALHNGRLQKHVRVVERFLE